MLMGEAFFWAISSVSQTQCFLCGLWTVASSYQPGVYLFCLIMEARVVSNSPWNQVCTWTPGLAASSYQCPGFQMFLSTFCFNVQMQFIDYLYIATMENCFYSICTFYRHFNAIHLYKVCITCIWWFHQASMVTLQNGYMYSWLYVLFKMHRTIQLLDSKSALHLII